MNFWKEHVTLRIFLMILFFIVGLVLVFVGWNMTGKLLGLGLMCLGIILMLTTLFIYNARFK